MGTFFVNALEKHLVALPQAIAFPLTFAAGLAAGIVTWALIDRWVMQRRNGWYSRKIGIRLGATGYALVITGLIGGLLIRANGG